MLDSTDTSDLLDFMKDSIEVLPDHRIQAVKEIDKYFFTVTKVTAVAETVVVEDYDSCQRALDVAGDVRSLAKNIDDERKRVIEPYRKIVQMVNDCAKSYQSKLDTAESGLKVKLAKWQLTEEIKALEAQKAVKELSETLGLDIEILAPDAPKTMSSAKASTSTREKVSFEIEDEKLVPKEYWVVDEDLIKHDIAQGRRNIPGVRILSEKTMIIRRK